VKNTALIYFLTGLAADLLIVSLTILILSAGYDGTCHTLMGGSYACTSSEYFENDVMLSLAALAVFLIPILLIVPIAGLIFGYMIRPR
jgi:hypothetical protein